MAIRLTTTGDNTLKRLFALLACAAGFALTANAIAAEPAPATGSESFTLYQFAGSSKALGMLDEQIQKDPRFKELGCERTNAGKSKQAPKYVCKQNTGRAYELFMSGVKSGIKMNSSATACPTGCVFTRCPPPSGPYKCCNTSNWQPC